MKQIFAIFLLFSLTQFLVSCNSGAGGDSLTDPTYDVSESSDSYSDEFPDEVIVASTTGTSSSSTTSTSSFRIKQLDGLEKSISALSGTDTAKELYQENLRTILFGTILGDCAVNVDFDTDFNDAACYGPRLTYNNHPDGADGSPAELPTGDLGIWKSTVDGSSEACAAGQLNQKMGAIGTQINSVSRVLSSIICIARVNGLSLPAQGDTLDVTSELSSAFTANGESITLSSATLFRDTNTSAGERVRVFSIAGTVGSNRTISARLKFIGLRTASSYRGKLAYHIGNDDGSQPLNCSASSETGYTDAASFTFEKVDANTFRTEVSYGQYCGDEANPYESSTNYTVDRTKVLNPGTREDGWANNFTQIYSEKDFSTGIEDTRMIWQAGYADDYGRIFQLEMTDDQEGCAYFGYTEEGVEDATLSEIQNIDRMICNWAGPGGTRTGQALRQRQCFNYSNTVGVYVPDTSRENISYAPTNSCDKAIVDNFQYQASFTTDGNVSVSTGTAVSNDLVGLATSTSTLTAAQDVDDE